MATVFDVAKYILDNYGSMSALRLQMLTFYSQAMSLVWDDVPLFDDDFILDGHFVVCPALDNAYADMRPADDFFILHDSKFLDEYQPDISRLTDEQRETIDAVVGGLIDHQPYILFDMIHRELPHLSIDDRGIISKESMEEYYLCWT